MAKCISGMAPLAGTMFHINYFYHYCDKNSKRNNLTDGIFILARDFRGTLVCHTEYSIVAQHKSTASPITDKQQGTSESS